jgi:uncharacterized repeat protein (TIGR01451 family)
VGHAGGLARRLAVGLVMALALGQAAGHANPARAGTPPAGTAVDNRAQAAATDSASAAPLAIASNLVRAVVQAQEAWLLTGTANDTLAAGATVTLSHRLTNAGNGTAGARLDLTNLAGDDFDLTALTLVHDVNANGIVDAGDVTIAPGGTITLAAGAAAELLAQGTVPAGTWASAHAWLLLTATGSGPGSVASADTLVVQPATGTPAVLFVDKSATRTSVEIGDDVDYTVRVANRSDTSFAAVTVTDALPLGFAYLSATARRDGVAITDPAGGSGPMLTFPLGPLGPNRVATLRYRVRVSPTGRDGDGVNRAWATAGPVVSNVATAGMLVTAGPFADEGTIVGTVFVDRDGDRRQGTGEPGLAGVRLYLDDGTFAVTDADGAYSLYGLTPHTHALKTDETTLPLHGRLVATDHRQGEGSSVRFVDLQLGDIQRADFAFAATPESPSPTPRDSAVADSAMIAEARWRAERMRAGTNELARGLRRELSSTAGAGPEGDPRGRPTSGLIDGPPQGTGPDMRPGMGPREGVPAGPLLADALPTSGMPADSSAETRGAHGEPQAAGHELPVPLEDLLPALDVTLGFVGLADGDTARARQIAIVVKGPRGYVFELVVNGKPLGVDRVGRKVTVASRALEVWEYVGVPLVPGVNRLDLVQRDAAWREIARATVRLMAPDRLSRIAVLAPAHVPADGQSRVPVRVMALDQRGVPVPERTFVTLETTLGRWETPDLDPVRPGLQTAVDGGEATVELVASDAPGQARVSAVAVDAPASAGLAGALSAERVITFDPELRPLLVVGAAEGTVALRDLFGGARAASRPATGFEQSIDAFTTRFGDRTAAGVRSALFMKGRLRESIQLMVGWDSDRPPGTRRFRDIQPDAFYPIYGDAAVRGYEAQSAGRLYARLDRRGTSLLYGDFLTQGGSGVRTLSAYSRSLTGIQERIETPRFSVTSFGSRGHSVRQIDELRGRGISGPYDLTRLPMVENSEQVEIVVRDRNQPSVVLSAEPRTRFVDYTLDALTGRLLFAAPVPSLDPALNPVSIRVTYEVQGGGDGFWVAGGEARVKVAPRIELGGSYVDDHDPTSPYGLRSAFAAARLGPVTTLEGEFALSDRQAEGSGQGGRLELRHDGTRAAGRLFGAVTDRDFVNPGGGYGPGRSEAGGRYSVRIAERSRLLAEGLYSADVSERDRHGGMLLALDQGITRSTRGEFGVRVASGRRVSALEDPTSVALRGKLQAQLPSRPELSGYAEMEQDLRETSRRMAAVGGEYRFSARGRFYARHELISSLSSVYALQTGERRLATVLGIDTDLRPETHVFSEYRLADVLAGREAEAALGLRNTWRVDGWQVSSSFERVSPLLGSSVGPSTAVTGGLESVSDENTRASARMEFRTGRESGSLLSTIGLASRLSPAWTLLGRTITNFTDLRARGTQVLMRLQVGMAYRRPDAEHWDVLSRYELHVDRQSDLPLTRRARVANVVSLHGTGRSLDLCTASLSWAGKLVREESDGILTFSGAHRLGTRLARDFGRAWDIGVNGSGLWGNGSRSRRYGLGLEMGRKLQRDVWLSAGWNYFGYHDPDLPQEEWTEAGLYLRMRAKFDEGLFQSLGVTR